MVAILGHMGSQWANTLCYVAGNGQKFGSHIGAVDEGRKSFANSQNTTWCLQSGGLQD